MRRIRLDPLNDPVLRPTCRHVAIRDFTTNSVIAYTHESEIFSTPSRDESVLIQEIKRITSRLATKTMTEAKLRCDGQSFAESSVEREDAAREAAR